MQIGFSPQELELLTDILASHSQDVHSELQRTGNPTYKRELKEEAELLNWGLERVPGPATGAGSGR
jgi:hypothetical protein